MSDRLVPMIHMIDRYKSENGQEYHHTNRNQDLTDFPDED